MVVRFGGPWTCIIPMVRDGARGRRLVLRSRVMRRPAARVILTRARQPLGFGPNGWWVNTRWVSFQIYRWSAPPNEQQRPNRSDMTSDRGLCAQKIACGALETLYCVVVLERGEKARRLSIHICNFAKQSRSFVA